MQEIGRRSVLAALAVAGLLASVDLSVPPQQTIAGNPVVQLVEPSFAVRWLRGELQLAGHTFSSQHEQDLRQAAKREFSSANIVSTFAPLGTVPDYWTEVTLALPKLLKGSVSGHAEISDTVVNLRVVSRDTAILQSRISALAAQLPATIELRVDVIAVDADFSVAAACSDAFAEFSAGEIRFEENSAEFRPSALPRLARVADLAVKCRSASLQITGHTDASGDEAWNKSLSLQRANAVANYLENLGIGRQRLHVEGAGSSQPLRSNNTRYGRSKNRRIEISFLSG